MAAVTACQYTCRQHQPPSAAGLVGIGGLPCQGRRRHHISRGWAGDGVLHADGGICSFCVLQLQAVSAAAAAAAHHARASDGGCDPALIDLVCMCALQSSNCPEQSGEQSRVLTSHLRVCSAACRKFIHTSMPLPCIACVRLLTVRMLSDLSLPLPCAASEAALGLPRPGCRPSRGSRPAASFLAAFIPRRQQEAGGSSRQQQQQSQQQNEALHAEFMRSKCMSNQGSIDC